MATEKQPLSPKAKKAMIYGGLGLAGALAVYVATMQTEAAPQIKEPEEISLTGNVDTRSVSLEGLSRRLTDLEAGREASSSEQRSDMRLMQQQVTELTKLIERMQDENAARARRMQVAIDNAAAAPVVAANPTDSDPVSINTAETQNRINQIADQLDVQKAQRELEAEEARLRRERDRIERERRESIYTQPEPIVQQQAASVAAMPAPRIAVYQSEAEPVEAEEGEVEPLVNVPDVNIPAGSIMTAMLLTGLDAPTGARAQSQPVPVLMRIKKEAIMPNHAWADVKECHLLGSAYGDLASERVNIRGETVSCVLADNTAVEGTVKFFVTGEDGKNGVRGTLVSRSGRVLASAAGAALAQGLLSSMKDQSAESVFLGGGTGGGESGAITGASEGFDLLTEYYLDLAEQTFPVIEIPNGRWVDVVLTEMLTVKFKG